MLCMNPGGLIIDVFCNFKALRKIKFRAQEISFTQKWFIFFSKDLFLSFFCLYCKGSAARARMTCNMGSMFFISISA